jgi:uracil-DNA glycosylase
MATVKIAADWAEVLKAEFDMPYFEALVAFLKNEKESGQVIYPPGSQIFAAFDITPFDSVKVVILGQDPYHGPGQAHGLCFSVAAGVPPPPSLINIYKEIETDLGITIPKTRGNLTYWAKQGVLLLNSIMTVRANTPTSHQKKGWERFTDAVIQQLNLQKNGIVFLLWGKYAQDKGRIIDTQKHHVLKAGHPSPLSMQHFFGCKHFSKTNELLLAQGLAPIDWSLPE